MSSGRFAKREREKAKRERAVNKRERRESRRNDTTDEPASPPRDQADVLAALEALHVAHEKGDVTFDDFETAKADLLAQLQL